MKDKIKKQAEEYADNHWEDIKGRYSYVAMRNALLYAFIAGYELVAQWNNPDEKPIKKNDLYSIYVIIIVKNKRFWGFYDFENNWWCLTYDLEHNCQFINRELRIDCWQYLSKPIEK